MAVWFELDVDRTRAARARRPAAAAA